MISLTQTALMGIAGYAIGNMVSKGGAGGESKGLALGWDPTVSVIVAVLITVLVAFVFGAIASRSYGIYFLMLTLTFGVILNLFFGSVTKLGGFSPIAGIDRNAPDWVGDIVTDRDRLYYIALGCALVGYVLIRFLARTPFGLSLQGVRDEPVRMASLGYAVPLHRMLAFTFAGLLAGVAGVLACLVERPDLALRPRAQRDDHAARDGRHRRSRRESRAPSSARSRSRSSRTRCARASSSTSSCRCPSSAARSPPSSASSSWPSSSSLPTG